jgi:hypothetical protein
LALFYLSTTVTFAQVGGFAAESTTTVGDFASENTQPEQAISTAPIASPQYGARVVPSDPQIASKDISPATPSDTLRGKGEGNPEIDSTRFEEKTVSITNNGRPIALSKSRGPSVKNVRAIDSGGPGCFVNCLANSVPPDVVLECIGSCANCQYVNCAVCLGVGVYVVYQCAKNCFSEEMEGGPEN